MAMGLVANEPGPHIEHRSLFLMFNESLLRKKILQGMKPPVGVR
jgi:hypothetical protein